MKVQCPGCELNNTVEFRRPGFMKIEIVMFKCTSCESGLLYQVKQSKEDKLKVTFNCKISRSPLLMEMLRQEEQDKMEVGK